MLAQYPIVAALTQATIATARRRSGWPAATSPKCASAYSGSRIDPGVNALLGNPMALPSGALPGR